MNWDTAAPVQDDVRSIFEEKKSSRSVVRRQQGVWTRTIVDGKTHDLTFEGQNHIIKVLVQTYDVSSSTNQHCWSLAGTPTCSLSWRNEALEDNLMCVIVKLLCGSCRVRHV